MIEFSNVRFLNLCPDEIKITGFDALNLVNVIKRFAETIEQVENHSFKASNAGVVVFDDEYKTIVELAKLW